jgi:hypothetical protein
LNSWIFELGCEDVVSGGSLLPHQLIQTMVCHDAVALCIRVHTMIVTGRLAVNGHLEANGLLAGRRTQYEMQVAGRNATFFRRRTAEVRRPSSRAAWPG